MWPVTVSCHRLLGLPKHLLPLGASYIIYCLKSRTGMLSYKIAELCTTVTEKSLFMLIKLQKTWEVVQPSCHRESKIICNQANKVCLFLSADYFQTWVEETLDVLIANISHRS
jgi:hypothetical protein